MDESRKKWFWLLLGLGLVGVLAAAHFLPLGKWTEAFSKWVQGKGATGVAAFILAYVLGTILFFPGSIMTLAAGIIYGLGWGTVMALVGTGPGAVIAFLIGRYFARDMVERQAGKNEKFRAVDAAIGEEAWKIVGLLRLSPLIPFNFANYFFGITQVKFWPYAIATIIGMAPGTLLYVYLGYAGKATLGGKSEGETMRYIFLGVGLVATIAVTVYVSRLAGKKLKESSEESRASLTL